MFKYTVSIKVKESNQLNKYEVESKRVGLIKLNNIKIHYSNFPELYKDTLITLYSEHYEYNEKYDNYELEDNSKIIIEELIFNSKGELTNENI